MTQVQDPLLAILDLPSLQQTLLRDDARNLFEHLQKAVTQRLKSLNHGDLDRWLKSFAELPPASVSHLDLNRSSLHLGEPGDLTEPERQRLHSALRGLMPWRKGPFDFFGLHLDTEWRSDLKWDRLANKISPLNNRKVLDIGCGNGYHCWRMKAAGAASVIGIDPSLLFACQFAAVQKYVRQPDVHFLPLGIEHLPLSTQHFDSVFAMGVLYHRRSPMDFLQQLAAQLRPGGELILETLVVQGDEQTVLLPQDRYARMRNVWFLPSSRALALWLGRCGFGNIRLLGENLTETTEQRTTDWMQFESLAESLHPEIPSLTVEGLPRPLRSVIVATRK